MENRIIVLTYNVAHRKTYDAICLLKTMGYKNVLLLGVDFHYTKKFKPIIEHRPSKQFEIHPSILAKMMGYEYKSYADLNNVDPKDFSNDIILIAGAGIIPEKFIKMCTIINSHPGYLPYVRGLDAIKWALLEDKPIGVTTHLISNEPDSGILIARQLVDINPFDNIQSLAFRVYDLEIRMLIEAIAKVEDAKKENILLSSDQSIIHKRMPRELEKILIKKMIDRQANNLIQFCDSKE